MQQRDERLHGGVVAGRSDLAGVLSTVGSLLGGLLGLTPQPPFSNTSSATPLGFTSQVADPSHDLTQYQARTYNPAEAAWLQCDPHSGSPTDPTRLNHYAYVNNNPTNLIDPDGRDPIPNCHGSTSCANYYYSGTTPRDQCTARNGGDYTACNVGADSSGLYAPVVQTGNGHGAQILGGDGWGTDYQRPTPTLAQAQPGQHSGYYADPAGNAARYGQVAHGISDWGEYYDQATNDGTNGMSAIWQGDRILCYGQAACAAAAQYLQKYKGDADGAAWVAANYCYISPKACVSYDQDRGIASNLLQFAGALAMGSYAGAAAAETVGGLAES